MNKKLRPPIKVGIVSSSDGRGGAYACAYRLHQGLRQAGADSRMIVGAKTREDDSVLPANPGWGRFLPGLRRHIDTLPIRVLYKTRRRVPFYPAILPNKPALKQINGDFDVINLHWIAGGFLRLEQLQHIKKPVVWTLHDMWAFTGGCHYAEGCSRFEEKCGNCPLLNSSRDRDISRYIWWRRYKTYQKMDLTVVTPSRWLADLAASSSLFRDIRIEVIPNGLDLERYRPLIGQEKAREVLHLPQDKKLILFGAMGSTSDRRKGFDLLVDTLRILEKTEVADKIELVVYGAAAAPAEQLFGLKANYLGTLNDDITMALAYSASDVFVAPSREDNLPNTVVESLACGVPAVVFNVGGMPDIIEHHKNGYLAKAGDPVDLAQGINWVLEDNRRWEILSAQAREAAEQKYDIDTFAQRYYSLFDELLRRPGSAAV